MSVSEFDVFPPFSTEDALAVEATGGSISEDVVTAVPDCEWSFHSFLCLIVDSLYRGEKLAPSALCGNREWHQIQVIVLFWYRINNEEVPVNQGASFFCITQPG